MLGRDYEAEFFMRILVTGGAGFIGSNLAKRLALAGHDVTVLDNFNTGDFRTLIDFPGNVICGDCTLAPEKLGAPFQAVFFESAITGVVSPKDAAVNSTTNDQALMLHNNLEGFRSVLGWAAQWKAAVIWASSASIYGDSPAPNKETDAPRPLNIYAFSKLASERLSARWHKETGLPITALRYFNVYGPGEAHKGKLASMIYQLAQTMKKGIRPRVFKFGEQKRDFVYIDDVVQANLLALQAKVTGTFNIGSGVAGSFNQMIAALNQTLGTKLEAEYFDNPYSFTQDHTEADISAARSTLGYKPEYTTLAAGVAQYHKTGAL